MSKLLAQRYAQAFFKSSQDASNIEAVYVDVLLLKKVLAESQDFRDFLLNPTISTEKRKVIINGIFEKKIQPGTLQFLYFLETKGRLNLLGRVVECFADQYRQAKGIEEVLVTTSVVLGQEEREEVQKALKSKLNKNINAEFAVDSDLIGGIKVQVKDLVHDFSISYQLKNFEKQLLHV